MNSNYNPDVLSCLANLSNDEVFTPPVLANQMLDLLPETLWSDKNARFLDPVCKSGVFLREIAKRLMVGLEKEIPDKQKRANHILKNQLFGIAITELTGLMSRRTVYCSKYANGQYSVCSEFENEQGNIVYNRVEHTWKDEKCIYCGASQKEYDRATDMESHAYQFIHTKQGEKLFQNMKFDVIIGNPPYQLNDGGGMGTSATPIYQKFVQQAKKLNPRYLTMIIPARWFSGGKGLDEFRNEILRDKRIQQIVDFPEAIDCFPGVQIKGGVCYFLWNTAYSGDCKVSTSRKGVITSEMTRPLLEKGCETFIRYNEAISIFHKIQAKNETMLKDRISSRKPFGIDSNFKDYKQKPDVTNNIKLYRNGEPGFINERQIVKGLEYVNQIKVLISKAGSGSDSFPHQILGVPFIAERNSACTETFIILGTFDNLKHANNLISYVSTKFFRFLVLLIKNTQNAAKDVYSFVPTQDFNVTWTDEMLYQKYSINSTEQQFINSLIRPMELDHE